MAWGAMDDALRITRMDSLKRELPAGTPGAWSRHAVAENCIVVDVDRWNRTFPTLRLSRISDGT